MAKKSLSDLGELTTREIQEALFSKPDADAELAARIIAFLRRCDEWKFGPVHSPGQLGAAASALELLEKVEEQGKSVVSSQ